VLLFIGCDLPQEGAIGPDDEIVILCEDENFEIAEPILNETLGRTIITPQNESLYQFRRIVPEELTANLKAKNLIILTRLEVHSEISGQVRSILPDSTLTKVREHPNGYYLVENAYADGQVLLIIAAKSPPDLRNRLKRNQDEIFAFFERVFFRRQMDFIYRSGEQVEMAESYHHRYGWYLRMMHDFVEIENNPKKQFVWIGRDFPFRWITVAWTDPVDSLELEQQTLSFLRRTYGRLLEDVSLNEDYLLVSEEWLGSYSAMKYTGLWEHRNEVKGGPFVAYGFYEPVKDRIYMLTGLVYAPDRRKVPYIRQLASILHTFTHEVYEE